MGAHIDKTLSIILREKKVIKRKKLLALIPRHKLDVIYGMNKRPWYMDKPDLISVIAEEYDAGIHEQVIEYFKGVFNALL